LNKEEWDALSDEEKQEFYDKIKEHADFDSGESHKIDEEVDSELLDEISFDDIIYEDENIDTNEELEGFVTVDELGEIVDIIMDLMTGKQQVKPRV
jgi:curved DNA-binding protein CbpA